MVHQLRKTPQHMRLRLTMAIALAFCLVCMHGRFAYARCILAQHGDIVCDPDGLQSSDSPVRASGQIDEAGSAPAPIIDLNSRPRQIEKLDLAICANADPFRLFTDSIMENSMFGDKVMNGPQGLSVGIGHSVTPADHLSINDKITPDRIRDLWRQDSEAAMAAALSQAKEAGICNPCGIAVLASVNYQLGPFWVRKFGRSWTAIKSGNYRQAIAYLDESAWKKNNPMTVGELRILLLSLPPRPKSC